MKFLTKYIIISVQNCPDIPMIDHATRSTEATQVWTRVRYTCQDGYTFQNGSPVMEIECMGDKHWDRMPGPCSRESHALIRNCKGHNESLIEHNDFHSWMSGTSTSRTCQCWLHQ